MIFSISGFGQEKSYRNYSTQQTHERLSKENPEMQTNLLSMEESIQLFSASPQFQNFTISLVFHVVSDVENDFLSEQQIEEQITMLNRDFGEYSKRREPYSISEVDEFADLGVDPQISFCLARIPDAGGIKAGIEYVRTPVQKWELDDKIKDARNGSESIAPDKYLNIWIGHLEGSAGYAQMPGGKTETDGIVIDFDYFGSTGNFPYDQGKTLTHLIGNYLGLYDLWSDKELCKDDGVSDTPIHNAPNYWTDEQYYHTSSCRGNPTEMIINFMDNTFDEAQVLFTEGQKIRMQAVLSDPGIRGNLKKIISPCEEIIVDRNETTSNHQQSFNAYPNPAKDLVNLDVYLNDNSEFFIEAFNSNGSLIYSKKVLSETETSKLQINTSNWASGNYTIRLSFPNATALSKVLTISN